MVKLQQFVISEPDETCHGSWDASQQLITPVETSKLVVAVHLMISPLRYD